MGILSWLSSLVETSAETGPVRVQESLPGLDYSDIDANLPGTQAAGNWRRLTQSSTDLSPLTQDRMFELALYLSDKNPLAKGIVDLITAFVVGEGFTVTSKDKDVQATIDRFWEDGQNDLDQRVEDMTRELSIYGEQCVLAFVNEKSGRVALVSIDPKSVTAVIRHPMATDRAYAIELGSTGTTSEPRYVKIIAEDDDPQSDTAGKLVGPKDGERIKVGDHAVDFYQPDDLEPNMILAGCFFWPINKPRSSMRGRSDLLPVADFVDLYDRLLFDESERMSFLRAFVWHAKVTGASKEDLAQRALTEPAPKPGSVHWTNESEEWTAVSPDLNSADSQNTADLILSLIATGVGLPKLWLNGSMDINRATAQESADPALKRLTARQKFVRRAIERMIRFVLDQAEIAGALGPANDARHTFKVTAPEMSAKDMERAARSLLTSTQAMGMANAAGWIDEQTAQDAVAMMIGQLGMNLDLDELRLRLKAMAEEKASNDEWEIPAYFGMGQSAGSDTLTQALKDARNGTSQNGTAEHGAAAGAVPVVSPAAKDMAGVISTVSKSLVDLGNSRVIDGVVAQEIVAKLFAGLGIEIDLAAMRTRLEEEQAVADAAEQAPAEGPTAAGAPSADLSTLPDDVDGLIDLDAQAMESVRQIGYAALSEVNPYWVNTDADAQKTGLMLLTEAFEASLHPRGPGGQFASKAGGEGGGTAGSGASPEVEARAMELAREMIAKQKEKKPRAPRKPKDPNAPKAVRKPATPTMNTAELKATISGLKPGDAVTIGLVNGLEVSGTVEVAQSGVAMLKTADGKYAVLHSQLKGVASVSSADRTSTPGPRVPRKPRAPKAAVAAASGGG